MLRCKSLAQHAVAYAAEIGAHTKYSAYVIGLISYNLYTMSTYMSTTTFKSMTMLVSMLSYVCIVVLDHVSVLTMLVSNTHSL